MGYQILDEASILALRRKQRLWNINKNKVRKIKHSGKMIYQGKWIIKYSMKQEF